MQSFDAGVTTIIIITTAVATAAAFIFLFDR